LYKAAVRMWREFQYKIVTIEYEAIVSEIEAAFDVKVIDLFVRDDEPYALVYDDNAYAYYEMSIKHQEEPENPFDRAIDDLFGED
jgi:hypothetical protein